ncbi:MAG: DNA replication/repair protein RecF [Prolixibacteraceae bacterium]
MFIRELSVMNYKNFGEATLSFSRKLNCFIGNNGVGKTNLLDAIYYLSFCKSYFNNPDSQNVRHSEDFFALQGRYELNGINEEIHCGFKNGQKKKIRRNKKEYERFSDHIGLLPLVMISPADAVLIQGGSEERRRFMDSVISQYDRTYLEWLVRYNRALLQRNVLLKEVAGKSGIDPDIFAIWDDQLVQLGEKINLKRNRFLQELLPVFQKYYTLISGGNEIVSLEYSSQLNEKKFSDLLNDSFARDRMLQFTSTGIHKDDLELRLGGYPIRRLGSQGQNKTYLIALKFAQFDFIRSLNSIKPILLLDDIFDKLDSGRVEEIVKLVSDDHFGQIFITDTNREHLDGILREAGGDDFRIFVVEKGVINDVIDKR